MSDIRTEAIKMALEFIVIASSKDRAWFTEKEFEVVAALRQALAQPEQEPVAAVVSWEKSMITRLTEHLEPATFLYTAPPKREWQGLTDEQIYEHEWWDEETAFAVNKELKEKNT